MDKRQAEASHHVVKVVPLGSQRLFGSAFYRSDQENTVTAVTAAPLLHAEAPRYIPLPFENG